MLEKRWMQWLLILVGMLVAGFGLGGLLTGQGAQAAGRWMMWSCVAVSSAWILWGLWSYRERRWAKQLLGVFGGSYVVAIVYWMLVGLSEGAIQQQIATAIAGAWSMALLFFVGLAFIRMLLVPGYGIFAVARTLIDQAMRMKIVVVFIVGIGLLVPFLPMMYNEPRLEYQIQFFLTWSISVTSVLLSLMTIFLACGSICGDIRDRQIYMTMSKPISRLQYLVGKWLGVVLLNMLLLSVAGSGIYAFTKILEQSSAKDSADRMAVEDQVLVARVAMDPYPADGKDLYEMVNERFEQLKREQPETYTGDEPTEDQTRDIQTKVMVKWHTIGPRDSEIYVFAGLPVPEANTSWEQSESKWFEFRFKPKAVMKPDDGKIRLEMKVNGKSYPPGFMGSEQIVVADNTVHRIRIDSDRVDENGRLSIEMFNSLETTSVNFPPGSWLELYYKVGGFEMNFLRSFIVIWIRLGFLAMLGLAAGTFLGFPVAVLLSSMVYTGAAMSAYLNDSITFYTPFPRTDMSLFAKASFHFQMFTAAIGEGNYYNSFKVLIRIFGSMFMWLIPPFSKFDPVEFLANGQVVPGLMIYDAVWQIGMIGTGACGIFAWVVFRKRELAQVTI